MLTMKIRVQKILDATPAILAKIDAFLGAEPDCRTITKTEAARRLGVSIPTVYRLVRLGEIKTVETGGADRVLLQSVMDCKESRKRTASRKNEGTAQC